MRDAASTVVGDVPPALRSARVGNDILWGRTTQVTWINYSAALLVLIAPMGLYMNWLALEHFDGSLLLAIQTLSFRGLGLIWQFHPRPTILACLGYIVWLAWQGVLYRYLPRRKCFGSRTPGGYILQYTTNGFAAWVITHVLFLAGAVMGLIDPAIIASNWDGLFFAANAYGLILAVLVQVKGYYGPSFGKDCQMSGSWIFDFWAGVELNPRLGENFDIKFFHNGRPGIVAWTLIDISWAEYQRQTLGYVTTSMLIVLILHTIYVVDFFLNEDWYTKTIDITHDHFGFMLAWGDTTFLPFFYTLQAQYLARHPIHLTTIQSFLVLVTGIAGYTIFRLANAEKDYVRSFHGDAIVWGRPAEFIRCTYRTSDGKIHESLLLASGWWGLCRHSNYLGDLIMSFAMCAVTGTTHVLPWSYFVYMAVLLNHRIGRDEVKCHAKYGVKWEEYCRKVPYRLIPGLY